MFHVQLAPLGGILGPLKSDLGVFWAKIPLYPYNVKFSNSIFSKSANLPILSFWILNLHIIICQFKKRSTKKHFFSLSPCSCHMWAPWGSERANGETWIIDRSQPLFHFVPHGVVGSTSWSTRSRSSREVGSTLRCWRSWRSTTSCSSTRTIISTAPALSCISSFLPSVSSSSLSYASKSELTFNF